MPNLNTCFLMGHLTREPDSKQLPGGTTCVEFSIAINRTWKNDAGEKQEDTSFLDLVCYGKRAEVIAKYCHKGEAHQFTCRANQETWEKDGQKRSKIRFVVDDFQLLPNGKREGGDVPPKDKPKTDAPDDDIPY